MTNLKKIELPPRGMNTLFGVRDQNIKYLETLLNITIGARGNELNIDGEARDIETVEKILNDFAELFEQGNKFTDGELRDAFKQIAEDRAYSLKDYFINSRFNPSGKKQVAAKSANQRKYIEAIQNNDLVFGIGPAGTGKCIAEDSIILTEFGMLEIGELCRKAKPNEFLPADFAVSGINGRENVSHVYNGGKSKTLKINTRFGYSIEATPEHPLLIINTDGNLSWKRADKLNKGDFVTFQRGQKMFGNKIETNFLYHRKKHDNNSKIVELSVLDEDFAYIMGILTGDGCLTVQNRVIISSGDQKILDAFQNLADRFSLKVFLNNPSGFCYAIASSQLYELLIHLGMSNGTAETKFIPESILQAPQNIVAAFLRGLFDADGTVEKRDGVINYGSISEKLVKQIQIVLLNFGVVSSKAVKCGTYLGEKHFSHILSITGAEAEKFDELIGFGLKRKLIRRQNKIFNTNIDVIPNIGKKLNRAVKSAILTRAEHKKFWDYRIERRRPSYGKLVELLEILQNKNAKGESLNHLQAILEKRFLFLEIVAIEESEAQVYDLTVPETHSFTANGFINHNSFLAVAMAVQALFEKKVSRIILTRPAVEAGEKLGFLPGDLQDKVDPYLRPLYDALFDLVDGERVTKMLEKRIIEIAPLAFMRGRAQTLDSLLMTPNGWRKMGEIKVGDLVFGSDGKTTEVIGVFPQGKKKVYRLTMTDGSSAVACAEHLWQVKTMEDKRRNKPARVLETQEMLANFQRHHQYRYELPLLSAPVEFDFREVPIDPYALGLLLGDGCMTGKTSASFTTTDTEPAESLESAVAPMNLSLHRKTAIDYTITNPLAKNSGVAMRNFLLQSLKELNLLGTRSSTKFIPENYLYNSADVRIAVLQGLLDTDGGPVTQAGRTCRIQYTTVSEKLKDDIIFLVRSLGGAANYRKCKVEDKKPGFANGQIVYHRHDSHVLDIRLPEEIKPFRLSRKAAIYEKCGGGCPVRFIKNIEYIGEAQTQCISVDALDSLYITDDFILTHNTLADAFIILDEAQNTTSEQMKMFLTRIGFGSKTVVTGDKTQIDLPSGRKSGIKEAERILSRVEGISFVNFTDKDVVRHKLVQMIVRAYEKHSEEEEMKRAERREERNSNFDR